MIYHRPSIVGLMLWARYGLAMHAGRGLMIAKRIWPRPLIRRLPALDLLLLIEAWK